MARQLVAILAAAVAFSGVSAGPCKPVSSLALSSAILLETTTTATSHETASSTVTVDVIETTGAFDTTVTDATTDATGTTDAVDPTITESATDAATAGSITTFLTTTTTEQSPEQSTTTTAGPVGPGPCLEEQVLYNPSFDDSISSWPWDLNSGVQVSSVKPRSPSYCLLNTLISSHPSTTFSQALPALGDYEYELVYYISMQNFNGFDLLCYANAFVNGKKMWDSGNFDGLGPFTYQRVSEVFTPQNSDDAGELRFEIQCEGEFQYAEMAVDDVSLTRRCGA
ncbi:hypothetical protein IWW34DRAFT_426676 [Fusarium oxysporum f. sp. albedinis]|uniref:CBM-cenC domain-containing protein n=1 Tax=Fusarium oxysporum TaxID=5507 RepID=A0A8H5EDT3_FUSOX|nr:hypothetical protein FOXYS1_12559 [Fusarium oxysporum]KAI3580196.1 hypothetical protein IWW34DRAFT_426676 [Fusarium oxysporum f. sp. albedinis]KAJ0146328.1 Uncharacterized protein HZ326_10999 [Fusarium oxysporum f. sp. albedinis]KAK2472360.1 hypothetical protein H9L39_16240 [Fusarium oxysporum f. sp. albedinis]